MSVEWPQACLVVSLEQPSVGVVASARELLPLLSDLLGYYSLDHRSTY